MSALSKFLGPLTQFAPQGTKDFFLGTPSRFEQLPTQTPQQLSLSSQLQQGVGDALPSAFQNIMGILSGDPQALDAFQAPALRQFKEQIVPEIAERFTRGGGQRSSAFQQALGTAGASLSENLAAQRAQLQSQALNQLMSFLTQAQTPQFTTQQIAGTEGALPGILSALGMIGGTFLGGPAGTAAGGTIGRSLGGSFSRGFGG